MYFIGERLDSLENLQERIAQLSNKLNSGITEPHRTLNLIATDSIDSNFFNKDEICIIRQGIVKTKHDKTPIFYYESGDIIGLNESHGLNTMTYSCDDPVILDVYKADDFLRHVLRDTQTQAIWTSYLVTFSAAITLFLSQWVKAKQPVNAGYLTFNKGDKIITEGDLATEVYTIIKGSAEVYVKNTKVGSVLQDEIFGAMAVFTGERRTASVVSCEDNTSVLVVPKEDFIHLVQAHPKTTITLIENMARQIKSLNEQVIEKTDQVIL
ncbi:MAG: cyclic nucleotide-binding domain-containing protein [Saccharospirillaceae bacterium]|nr:cyclic nucleotide-binding domain-containing protein [Pseudomonadales bacterium]NRB80484.1 cyclic nucleotide-binding domain-containing protein [Saccharospirillaceae bacterium]